MEAATAAVEESADVDLIVLPELAATRYDLRRHLIDVAPQADDPRMMRLRDAAARARTVAVVGFAERVDDAPSALHNSALVIEADGSIAGIVRKTHLFGGETRVFTPGSAITPVPTSVGMLGVVVCFDIEFPEVGRTLAMAGADILVVLSANMHPYTDYHLTYAKSRAMENGIPLVLSNWVGQGPRFDFLGRSCIVSAKGEILADAGDQPGHAEATIQLAAMAELAADLDYLAHRRPQLYCL